MLSWPIGDRAELSRNRRREFEKRLNANSSLGLFPLDDAQLAHRQFIDIE